MSIAIDAGTGKKLWSHEAVVQGRLGGMGLQPPIPVAAHATWIAVSVEPVAKTVAATGPVPGAVIVGRDSRTGVQRWAVPVTATFGPQPCGSFVCVDDQRDDGSVVLEALDPATGKSRWARGVGGPVDLDAGPDMHTLVLILGPNPVVADLDPASGRPRWQTPLAPALGAKVTTDGGWSFRRFGDVVVVALDSDQPAAAAAMTPSGAVGIDLASGAIRWKQPGLTFPIELPFVADQTPQAGLSSFPLLVERDEASAGGQSITAKDLVRLDPATGVARWSVALNFTYGESDEIFGAVSPDGARLWLKNPGDHQLKGIDLFTGHAAAETGVVWTQDFGAEVSVPDAEDTYGGPPQLAVVTLPALRPATPSRRPPAVFTVETAPGRFWIDARGTVHGLKP